MSESDDLNVACQTNRREHGDFNEHRSFDQYVVMTSETQQQSADSTHQQMRGCQEQMSDIHGLQLYWGNLFFMVYAFLVYPCSGTHSENQAQITLSKSNNQNGLHD